MKIYLTKQLDNLKKGVIGYTKKYEDYASAESFNLDAAVRLLVEMTENLQ